MTKGCLPRVGRSTCPQPGRDFCTRPKTSTGRRDNAWHEDQVTAQRGDTDTAQASAAPGQQQTKYTVRFEALFEVSASSVVLATAAVHRTGSWSIPSTADPPWPTYPARWTWLTSLSASWSASTRAAASTNCKTKWRWARGLRATPPPTPPTPRTPCTSGSGPASPNRPPACWRDTSAQTPRRGGTGLPGGL